MESRCQIHTNVQLQSIAEQIKIIQGKEESSWLEPVLGALEFSRDLSKTQCKNNSSGEKLFLIPGGSYLAQTVRSPLGGGTGEAAPYVAVIAQSCVTSTRGVRNTIQTQHGL